MESELDESVFLTPEPPAPAPRTSTPTVLHSTLPGYIPSPDVGSVGFLNVSSVSYPPDSRPSSVPAPAPASSKDQTSVSDLKRMCLVCSAIREDEPDAPYNNVSNLANEILAVFR